MNKLFSSKILKKRSKIHLNKMIKTAVKKHWLCISVLGN
jgi:hypothetical protein